MIKSLLIATFGIIFLMLFWTIVQNGWRKLFTGKDSDQDVLADRRSCSGCSCITSCKEDGRKIYL